MDLQFHRTRQRPFIDLSKNIGNLAFLCVIRFTGKRRLYSIVGTGVFLSSLIISCYGFICLPAGYISFDQENNSFHSDNQNLAYIPTICLFCWCFFSKSGFLSMVTITSLSKFAHLKSHAFVFIFLKHV